MSEGWALQWEQQGKDCRGHRGAGSLMGFPLQWEHLREQRLLHPEESDRRRVMTIILTYPRVTQGWAYVYICIFNIILPIKVCIWDRKCEGEGKILWFHFFEGFFKGFYVKTLHREFSWKFFCGTKLSALPVWKKWNLSLIWQERDMVPT